MKLCKVLWLPPKNIKNKGDHMSFHFFQIKLCALCFCALLYELTEVCGLTQSAAAGSENCFGSRTVGIAWGKSQFNFAMFWLFHSSSQTCCLCSPWIFNSLVLKTAEPSLFLNLRSCTSCLLYLPDLPWPVVCIHSNLIDELLWLDGILHVTLIKMVLVFSV